jgi:uncharacterized membrane protein YagU involved in acid resistance
MEPPDRIGNDVVAEDVMLMRIEVDEAVDSGKWEEEPVARTMFKGAIAGVLATWAMNAATSWLYARESEEVRQRENDARNGQTAYVTAANRLASAGGLSLSSEQQERAGGAIHWSLGIAAGAAYALARRRLPAVSRVNGLPFGAGFFMVADELMNPVLGLTPGPAAFPWQAHARGLGGHLVFGVVTEGIMRGLDGVPRAVESC